MSHEVPQSVPEQPVNKPDNPTKETGADVEIISSKPVFTIETGDKEALSLIVSHYGEGAVYRIINGHMATDALEFGTDKARVEGHDFRRVADGAGYDVWGIEKKAIEMGLGPADVFCGTPSDLFAEEVETLNSRSLGIPLDRAAILVFDGSKLEEIQGTDGYAFADPENKKEALLGVIKFRQSLTELEEQLNALATNGDKIDFLEREVSENLNTKDDLEEKEPYLALSLIRVLYDESIQNTRHPSPESEARMGRLKNIAERLEYERLMVGFAVEMTYQIEMTRTGFRGQNNRRMELTRAWPDFVVKTILERLAEGDVDEKHKERLRRIIEEAHRCKVDFGL